MKKFSLALIAALALATAAKADTFTLDFPDITWTSTLAPTSVLFDIPANADGTTGPITINSITIDIEHTWAGDLILSVTNGTDTFDLRNLQGGNFDLGTAAGNAGDPAPYTFVAPGGGGVAPPGWAPLGGGLVDANSWVFGELPKNGWSLNIADPVGGDGGTVSRITIDFNKANVIPEPTSALVLFSVAALAVVRRRR